MHGDALAALAARAAHEPFFLASLLTAYAHSEGLDDSGLAAALDCPVGELTMIRLCRAPRTEPDEFWEDVHQVASRFGILPERLADVVQRGRVVVRLQLAKPVGDAGYLMAARDTDEGPQPEKPAENP
jgi:hypothetical protein